LEETVCRAELDDRLLLLRLYPDKFEKLEEYIEKITLKKEE